MAEEGTAAPAAPTAGALLRQAREAAGLHIAVLAATLKVPQRKLEALERDRLDELPDATFARALAQTVCRALKIDAAPVLALLPPATGAGLEHVASGLNTPFRDKPSQQDLAPARWLAHPGLIVVALLLVGAVVVWFWPQAASLPPPAEPASAPPSVDVAPNPPTAADAASMPEAGIPAEGAASEVVASTAAGPLVALAPAAGSAPLVQPAPAADAAVTQSAAVPQLNVRTTADSWVEVVDASGRTLLSRVVAAGESVALDDGALPLRVVIGNASGTALQFRGQAVSLVPVGGTNVARLELK